MENNKKVFSISFINKAALLLGFARAAIIGAGALTPLAISLNVWASEDECGDGKNPELPTSVKRALDDTDQISRKLIDKDGRRQSRDLLRSLVGSLFLEGKSGPEKAKLYAQIDRLLEKGVNPFIFHREGTVSLLDFAALEGQSYTVKKLLNPRFQKNLNSKIIDSTLKTAIDRHDELLEELEESQNKPQPLLLGKIQEQENIIKMLRAFGPSKIPGLRSPVSSPSRARAVQSPHESKIKFPSQVSQENKLKPSQIGGSRTVDDSKLFEKLQKVARHKQNINNLKVVPLENTEDELVSEQKQITSLLNVKRTQGKVPNPFVYSSMRSSNLLVEGAGSGNLFLVQTLLAYPQAKNPVFLRKALESSKKFQLILQEKIESLQSEEEEERNASRSQNKGEQGPSLETHELQGRLDAAIQDLEDQEKIVRTLSRVLREVEQQKK